MIKPLIIKTDKKHMFNKVIGLLLLSLPLFGEVEYKIVPLIEESVKSTDKGVYSHAAELNENGYVTGTYTELNGTRVIKSGRFVYHPAFGFQNIQPFNNSTAVSAKVNNNGVVCGFVQNTRENAFFIFDSQSKKYVEVDTFNVLERDGSDAIEVLAVSDDNKVLVSNTYENKTTGYLYDIAKDKIFQKVKYPLKTKKKGREFDFEVHHPAHLSSNGKLVGDQWYRYKQKKLKSYTILHPEAPYLQQDKIGEKGNVAGFMVDNETKTSFVWDPEKGLATLDQEDVEIKAINNQSQIVGYLRNDRNVAFLFDHSQGLRVLGSEWEKGIANSINDKTEVVGAVSHDDDDDEPHAFIWDADRGLRLLEQLISPDAGWSKLYEADKINNKGYIIGYGVYKGTHCAFLLIPETQPTK